MANEAGWRLVNVDVTIVAQTPRLAPYVGAMIEAVASALGVDESCVWVKATTTDGMGFTGRSEGIAAMAVASLERLKVPE